MQSDPWLEILRHALATEQTPQAWPQDGEDAAAWRLLVEEILALNNFLAALSRGDLSAELKMRGQVAGNLKALQANLRHLTWQVQQVAAGNLSQRVDFMGDFSEAFNSMVDSLGRSQAAERNQRALAEALRDTAAALNSALKLEDVFDAILANLSKVVPHDAVDILLVEDERKTGKDRKAIVARFAGFQGASEEDLEEFGKMELSLNHTRNLREMNQSGQPCLIDDLNAYDWIYTGAARDQRSYLGAPVRIDDITVGFLGVFSKKANFFTLEHSQHLMAFADQAAIAIRNARQFEKLKLQSITDSLTGIHNRRYFMQSAEREIKLATRSEVPLSALMLDIDHFKRINDIYGHAAGDQVLTAVAQTCKGRMRDTDVFGRYGGEEFAAILPKTDQEGAYKLADGLRDVVASQTISLVNEQVEVTVNVSIGVAELRPDVPSLLVLLDHADQALYQAKQNGRNRVEVYT